MAVNGTVLIISLPPIPAQKRRRAQGSVGKAKGMGQKERIGRKGERGKRRIWEMGKLGS
jgi:hypothetical protein